VRNVVFASFYFMKVVHEGFVSMFRLGSFGFHEWMRISCIYELGFEKKYMLIKNMR
jgi:hypothetical protein